MKTKTTKGKSEEDIHKIIKDGLTSILTSVNPELGKKKLKKSVRKAGKILYRGAKIKKTVKKKDDAATVAAKA